MPSLSEQTKRAMTSQETQAVVLHLLTFSYDGNTVLRLVDDKQEIVSNGETYVPCSFNVILPDKTSDGNKACRLSVDNADISIYRSIKQCAESSRSDNKPIVCEVRVILSTEPDDCMEGPLRFFLRNIQADVQSITGEMCDSYMTDRNFSSLTYSPKDFPGLFF